MAAKDLPHRSLLPLNKVSFTAKQTCRIHPWLVSEGEDWEKVEGASKLLESLQVLLMCCKCVAKVLLMPALGVPPVSIGCFITKVKGTFFGMSRFSSTNYDSLTTTDLFINKVKGTFFGMSES